MQIVVNRGKSRLIATIKLATFGLTFGHFYFALAGDMPLSKLDFFQPATNWLSTPFDLSAP
jgi:hypothetical protein